MSNKNPENNPTPDQVARTQELRDLMARNELNAADVAEMINVKVSTVYVYRCLTSGTVISDNDLRLIKLELAAREAGE